MQDAKKDPRKINEEDYYEHKGIPQETVQEGYIPINERKDAYFAEFQKYKENKSKLITKCFNMYMLNIAFRGGIR